MKGNDHHVRGIAWDTNVSFDVVGKLVFLFFYQYTGLWYEIEGYPSTFQQGTCNNAFYELVGGVVDVYNTQVINQTLDEIYGIAVVASTDGSAKLTVTFPVDGNPDGKII